LNVLLWIVPHTVGAFDSKYYIVKTFVMLLYFSTSLVTSVGYGEIFPKTWYLYLITSSQMLIGVVYTVAILGRGLEVIAQGVYIGATSQPRSKEKERDRLAAAGAAAESESSRPSSRASRGREELIV
jgi:hypothetical protein